MYNVYISHWKYVIIALSNLLLVYTAWIYNNVFKIINVFPYSLLIIADIEHAMINRQLQLTMLTI